MKDAVFECKHIDFEKNYMGKPKLSYDTNARNR